MQFPPTLFTFLKSISVKTFPRNGRGQGPGGKLEGFLYLMISIRSSKTKLKMIQILKSKLSYINCRIMVLKKLAQSLCQSVLSAGFSSW